MANHECPTNPKARMLIMPLLNLIDIAKMAGASVHYIRENLN
jgi:hypothetical protein